MVSCRVIGIIWFYFGNKDIYIYIVRVEKLDFNFIGMYV